MKSTCTHENDVERWFDGEQPNDPQLESHIEQCTTCQKHLAFLKTCRASLEALPETPTVDDAQMPAFLAGISESVHAPKRRHAGLWAMASVSAAALIVAVSMMSITSEGPTPVAADTIVETYSTDIDGASVELFRTDSDTPTIWLNASDTPTVWLNVSEDGEL